MLKKIVSSAARIAVFTLNNLADRIDRAHKQVLRAENRRNRGLKTATLGKRSDVKPDLFKQDRIDNEATNAVMAKLNVGRSKDLQHHIPTSRHS